VAIGSSVQAIPAGRPPIRDGRAGLFAPAELEHLKQLFDSDFAVRLLNNLIFQNESNAYLRTVCSIPVEISAGIRLLLNSPQSWLSFSFPSLEVCKWAARSANPTQFQLFLRRSVFIVTALEL
jgi:hypothetical protein